MGDKYLSQNFTETLRTVAKDLLRQAEMIEEREKREPWTGDSFVTELPDFPYDSVALVWCDGFGPVRPWREGDPAPGAAGLRESLESVVDDLHFSFHGSTDLSECSFAQCRDAAAALAVATRSGASTDGGGSTHG